MITPCQQQSGPTTASTRKTAVAVGLLFLTATAAFIVADTLNSGVLSLPNFLTGAFAETNALATAALMLFGQFGVAELAATLFSLSVPLLAIQLGAGLRDGSRRDAASPAPRGHPPDLPGHAAAGMCMATLLYRSRLIPRWLAILGLIIYPTLLAGGFLDMFNLVDMTQGVGLAALVPGTLFELILPIWLIVKGATFPSDT